MQPTYVIMQSCVRVPAPHFSAHICTTTHIWVHTYIHRLPHEVGGRRSERLSTSMVEQMNECGRIRDWRGKRVRRFDPPCTPSRTVAHTPPSLSVGLLSFHLPRFSSPAQHKWSPGCAHDAYTAFGQGRLQMTNKTKTVFVSCNEREICQFSLVAHINRRASVLESRNFIIRWE